MIKQHQKSCVNCGQPYKTFRPEQQFHSLRCSADYKRKMSSKHHTDKAITKICLWCGNPYQTERPWQKYCGKTCVGLSQRKQRPEPVKKNNAPPYIESADQIWDRAKPNYPLGYEVLRAKGQDGIMRRRMAHIIVWERAHGRIPEGWTIHHIDMVRHNNALENLMALPRGLHKQLHHEMAAIRDDPDYQIKYQKMLLEYKALAKLILRQGR